MPYFSFIKITLGFIILSFGVMLSIVLSGSSDKLLQADLIVVLGGQVSHDGTLSKVLQDRLDKAIEVYQSGYAPLILVSGGVGQEGVDESISMANYLTQHDIPLSRIIKDGQGNNTRATAKNTFRYLQENHLKSVIIVSQYYHIQRCKLAFKQAGIEIIGQAAATHLNSDDLHSIMREMIGYPAYYFKFK